MITVVKAAGATVANKALQLIVQTSDGLLSDVDAAWFQIFDTTTADKEETPVQVAPNSGRTALDVVASRLGTGRYAATWDSSAAPVGRYVVRWAYRLTSTGPEATFDQEFEVAPAPYIGPHYCTLYDLKADGLQVATAGDGKAQKLIVQASRYIEHYTGRQFDAAYKTLTANGTAGRALLLDEPIVAIDALNISYLGEFATMNRDVGTYRVFNRHLTEHLFLPDDRDNPKLEFLHGLDWARYRSDDETRFDYYFRAGVKNIQISGLFGYTEPDASMVGQTPDLIRLACRLFCAYSQYPPGSQQRRDLFNRGRLTSEYTRDQGYILDKPTTGRAAPFITHTMDPEIDAILFGFIRPPQLGAP